ncbi:Bacitracin transport permease protein BCRC [Methanosarcina siciliae C2J]|uniref:Bacitracin transport permease protein BCRC n=2 Tax=Methanosarcina siciliae TaxID=38027 RepID=A0A0E3PNW6_9EURY|nr:Bacitracin transport permease protein BCRC [Methanosarcina siciliae C2J]
MITNQNLALFHLINDMAGKSSALDTTMIFAANYLIFLFAVYLTYIWFAKNEYRQEALFAGYAALLGLGINFIITLFYFHPRPFMLPTGTLLIAHAAESSFPSDHATIMFSVSLMLLTSGLRRNGAIFFILALLSGFARVYAGLHFPMDMAGSLLVASLSVGILLALKKYLIPINRVLITYFENIETGIKV